MTHIHHLISQRITIARDRAGLSQDALARALGFNDRQTISAMETGLRQVSPEELVRIGEVLGQQLEFFTDPYVVAEKNAFSYRAAKPAKAVLEEFERQSERLISAHRRFRELLRETPSPVQAQLPDLTPGSHLELATLKGEQTAAAWKLGGRPAEKLREEIEKRLNIAILYVDAPESISGAACRLPDGGVILINRLEALCRQNFNLGHELFHLLTWEKMPPEHIDVVPEKDKPRSKSEKLADAYTAGLLMPAAVIHSRWQARGKEPVINWIKSNARELQVSSIALYWRTVNLRLIGKEDVDISALKVDGSTRGEKKPRLYSQRFVERLHSVLDEGYITVLKATELLDCSLDDLRALFSSYGLGVPFPS